MSRLKYLIVNRNIVSIHCLSKRDLKIQSTTASTLYVDDGTISRTIYIQLLDIPL